MLDLALVMKGASLGFSVAKYTGIVQDKLKLKVEQLAGSELEAGLRALHQAANSDQERDSLLREARSRFNKAISLEKNFRLAATYLGLALCHVNLCDAANAERAITELAQLDAPRPSVLLVAGRAVNKMPWTAVALSAFFPPLAVQLANAKLAAPVAEKMLAQHEEAVEKLAELQREAKLLLAQSLRQGCESVFGLSKRCT